MARKTTAMTSIPIPPTLPDLPSAGTPSSEWASSTNSMLGSAQQVHSAGSTVSTPGVDFPGSYPKDRNEHVTSSTTSGSNLFKNPDGSPVGVNYVQSAKQYMPDQMERGIETAGQTAAAYFPIPQGVKDTVSSYWKPGQPGGPETQGNGTSLPSTEHGGAEPSERVSAGVGALPGSIDEREVAVLPEERALNDRCRPVAQGNGISLPSTEHEGAKPSDRLSAGVGALPGSANERNVAILPEERAVNDGPKVPIGVGDLPGSSDETGVVLLPDERASGQAHDQTKEVSDTSKPSAPAEPTPGELPAGNFGRVPKDIPHAPDSTSSDPKPAESHTNTTSAPNQGADYHPAKLHPPPAGANGDEVTNPAASTGADENGPSSAGSGAADRESEDLPPRESKTSKDSQRRKSGFMAMVKSEMKIISGKISGNDGKVEEGKKIKMGEA